ncbi:MAG: 23S rRNA (guanosine(2251)-2'-O)-methyltransferase RlmB [Thermoleophilia bacterium]
MRDLKHQRVDLVEKKLLHEAKRAARSLRQQSSASEGSPLAGATGDAGVLGGDDWRGMPDKRDAHERPRRHGSEWIYGRNVAKLALTSGSRRRVQAVAATVSALHTLEGAIDLNGLEQRITTTDDLDQLTSTHEHQGVALRVPVFHYAQLEELFDTALIVVLDEVTDPRNVGAVARSALASGAGGLVLPNHRSAAVTPAAVKASAGATEHLPIVQVTNVVAALNELKQHGFWVYGTSSEAEVSYRQLDYGGKVALVFGSEGRGLRPLVARTCDELAAIPVKAPMASLNISVAAGLFLYEARRGLDVQAAQGQSEHGVSRERTAPSD